MNSCKVVYHCTDEFSCDFARPRYDGLAGCRSYDDVRGECQRESASAAALGVEATKVWNRMFDCLEAIKDDPIVL